MVGPWRHVGLKVACLIWVKLRYGSSWLFVDLRKRGTGHWHRTMCRMYGGVWCVGRRVFPLRLRACLLMCLEHQGLQLLLWSGFDGGLFLSIKAWSRNVLRGRREGLRCVKNNYPNSLSPHHPSTPLTNISITAINWPFYFSSSLIVENPWACARGTSE